MVLNNTVKARSISQEFVVGTDDRQRVTNTQQAPWNQIALITLRSGDGTLAGGSGGVD